jgi:hypothetical protein
MNPREYIDLRNARPLWWCNSHQREATYAYVQHGKDCELKLVHCCDPCLGGILLPCFCVELTGLVEIEKSV